MKRGERTYSVTLRERKSREGDTIQYLTIYVDGQQKSESLGKSLYLLKDDSAKAIKKKRAAAEELRSRREQEIRDMVTIGNMTNVMTDIPFFAYYQKCADERRGTTRQSWIAALNFLHDYEKNEYILLRRITPDWVKGFREYLLTTKTFNRKLHGIDPYHAKDAQSETISQNTAANVFSKLRACLNQADREGVIAKSPCASVEIIPIQEVERSYLTADEIKAISNTDVEDEEVKRAFLFACFTGLRHSDIYSLTWGMIDDNDGVVRMAKRMKKTGRFVYQDLNTNAVKQLGERGNADDFIFPKYRDCKYANDRIKSMCKKAGITKKVTTHIARHTFAVLLLSKDVDVYVVSKLLGHTKIQTTQIYAKVLDESKTKALKTLDSIEL